LYKIRLPVPDAFVSVNCQGKNTHAGAVLHTQVDLPDGNLMRFSAEGTLHVFFPRPVQFLFWPRKTPKRCIFEDIC
jgi:hypothetical protein